MLAQANNRPELRLPLGDAGDIAAQVVFAIREEMALHLSDVVMRRTCLGQIGTPPSAALDSASRIMAAELGWSEDRRNSEIAALAPWFKTRQAA
jgi:glycerol-3-phosphate dehydrogenase